MIFGKDSCITNTSGYDFRKGHPQRAPQLHINDDPMSRSSAGTLTTQATFYPRLGGGISSTEEIHGAQGHGRANDGPDDLIRKAADLLEQLPAGPVLLEDLLLHGLLQFLVSLSYRSER